MPDVASKAGPAIGKHASANQSPTWAYPFALRDTSKPDAMRAHFDALSVMRQGFFPIAASGFPNGSLHIGSECTGFVTDKGFRCIADGEVLAYRLDESEHLLRYDDGVTLRYTLGFVLVRHRLALPLEASPPASEPTRHTLAPDEPTDGGIDIFSLYSYNQPLDAYRRDDDGSITDAMPFWECARMYRVGQGASDSQIRLTDIENGEYHGVKVYGLPLFIAPRRATAEGELEAPTPLMVGIRVRVQGDSRAAVMGLLPRGSILTVEPNPGNGWAKILTIERGSLLNYVEGMPAPEDAIGGWVFVGELEGTVAPNVFDKVVVLSTPHPVKAGEVIGFLGTNPGRGDADQPGEIRAAMPRVAIEVFAGDDFPAYLSETRRRADSLPLEDRHVLIVERGAKLCEKARKPDLTFGADYVVIPEAPTIGGGPFVYGRLYRAVARALDSRLGHDEKATNYRVSADGHAHVSLTAFRALSAAEQARYPMRAVLVLADGNKLCWGQSDSELFGRSTCIWTQRPMVPEQGTATVGFTTSFNRAALDALEESRRFVDADGSHWWKALVGGDSNEPLIAWVCEKDHPGTRWVSPHAWPGFELADGSMFEPFESLQRIVCVTGEVHPQHEDSFLPIATALSDSELIVKLEKAVDHTGTLDGKITAEDIAKARTIPWLAQPLSRLICRFQSQWSNDVDRWKALAPFMDRHWQVEMKRQEQRGWWKNVASKVEGFPADPRVHHFHPFGLIDNFTTERSMHPRITVDGHKVTISFLDKFSGQLLTEDDYENAAHDLSCEGNVIKAIARTESGSDAFFHPVKVHAPGDDAVPAILYERHVFHKLTRGVHDHTDPEISDKAHYIRKLDLYEQESQKRTLYGPPSKQYRRLLRAYALDPSAALKSASWGKFQIMGHNHSSVGHASVEAFVRSLSLSEKAHLDGLVSFIRANRNLHAAVQAKDWVAIANIYNGPGHKSYDVKLRNSYDAITRTR